MTTLELPRGAQLRGLDRAKAAERAAELYVQGCTIRSVAAQLGRSYGCARALLLEAGVQLRPKGGPRFREAAT
ncbi:helix-turn-helix domain-containing protein [Streptomyces longwoodensis]|uniref:helix-turn-helix domain-containing protein n=1 Tax=Streptomyces longwoodensis TaxID=68231 RepID=UPI0033CF7782